MHIREGHPVLWKHNIIGLKTAVASHVFPLGLTSFQLAFAVYDLLHIEHSRISFVSQAGVEVFYIDINRAEQAPDGETTAPELLSTSDGDTQTDNRHETYMLADEPGWSFFVYDLKSLDETVLEPGEYSVRCRRGENDKPLGFLNFYYVPAAPLTPERVAAIRSNPFASKTVRYSIGCKVCHQELKTYAGLERHAKDEGEGWTWYQSLPDTFSCRCGKATFNLSMLRESLHSLLGNHARQDNNVSCEAMYTRSMYEVVYNRFASVLDRCTKEEEVQDFIKRNPLVLQQFSPESIYPKAPVLTHHATDFAILNSRGELVLIEIERPDRHLMKGKGHVHSDLQHALDQVRDWLYTVEHQRSAVLDCIGLRSEQVTTVKE
jgi:hypothetical protein